MKLYSYFRSSAAFRLRIALNLKGLDYEILPVNLLQAEQKAPGYMALNPQGLVPALEMPDGGVLGQSVALLEWLEETYPEPAFLPTEPGLRARVRSVVNSICCDIHPICNIAVTNYLKDHFDAAPGDITGWYTAWMHRGFSAIEKMVRQDSEFCFGDTPGMADIFLVPQFYNARRFDIPLDEFPTLCRIEGRCKSLPAFADAAPEQQPDSTL